MTHLHSCSALVNCLTPATAVVRSTHCSTWYAACCSSAAQFPFCTPQGPPGAEIRAGQVPKSLHKFAEGRAGVPIFASSTLPGVRSKLMLVDLHIRSFTTVRHVRRESERLLVAAEKSMARLLPPRITDLFPRFLTPPLHLLLLSRLHAGRLPTRPC